ncbi:hypothetical protein [Thermomonospora cellulosilytica]|uniref:Secreted protein n=1 Tax=Thermomonospora cellulosilytica TaxID=1411118 RepID=A0A7W3MZL9_9ACTN|nr:hypothetical protein [Thermomonospora cellulosilytica]MBA9004818.1 hypothetical protein [Thermomonospora cellulosilytica]
MRGDAVRVLCWLLCLCMCLPAVPVAASWDDGERRGGSAVSTDPLPTEREESEKLKRAIVISRVRDTEEAHRAPAATRNERRAWHRIAQWRAARTLRLYGFGGRSWWSGPPDTGERLARIQVLRC